jgi:MoxR-like ATPase
VTTAEKQLVDAFSGVDPSAPSTTQLRPLDVLFAQQLGYTPEQVYTISVSKSGNLVKQAGQSQRGHQAKVLVAVTKEPEVVDGAVRHGPKVIGPGWFDAMLVIDATNHHKPKLDGVVQPNGSSVASVLSGSFNGFTTHDVEPLYKQDPSTATTSPPPIMHNATLPAVPLVLDPRIKRMLRLAIASSKAVMLVGPPGTGKTTIVDEALTEIAAQPAAYGLNSPPAGVREVTPEEGWTNRDLVGGETVDDDGRLRFRPGHVLEAIRDNQWLVLDEANRSDMDKIFGGLLTFLSHKPVTLGRASNELDAARVTLEWGTDATCSVEGYDRLDTGAGDPIRFIAGTDWRLIGTYNVLDAQRVFRFGQALGRRFTRIPVPPISPADFSQALKPHLEALPPEVSKADVEAVLRGLYEEHLNTSPPLGPALFLAIPSYVANGLSLLDLDDLADAPSDSTSTQKPDDAALVAQATAELLAEGYLLGAGSWLAQLDEAELEDFHARAITDRKLLSETQWSFIKSLLPALA